MINVDLKEVVRQFELTLSNSGEFKDVRIVVEDDYDAGALLELQNESYCIELRFEEETVGIAKRRVHMLHYRCSYPRVISGGNREPDDVDIVEFADCTTVHAACIAIHANSFAQRIDSIKEFEDFEQFYDITHSPFIPTEEQIRFQLSTIQRGRDILKGKAT